MAFRCRYCGCLQNDEKELRRGRRMYPGFADPDIPYLCGACREAGFGDEDLFVPRMVEICFGDLTPEAQKRLLDGFGICGPEEENWDVFPVFVLYPGIEDFSEYEEF